MPGGVSGYFASHPGVGRSKETLHVLRVTWLILWLGNLILTEPQPFGMTYVTSAAAAAANVLHIRYAVLA
jgi:hypothetical protein